MTAVFVQCPAENIPTKINICNFDIRMPDLYFIYCFSLFFVAKFIQIAFDPVMIFNQ